MTDILSAISLTNETNLRRQMPAICRMSIYCLTKELKSYSGLWGRVLQCGGGYAGFAGNCGVAYTPKRDMSMRIGRGVCIGLLASATRCKAFPFGGGAGVDDICLAQLPCAVRNFLMDDLFLLLSNAFLSLSLSPYSVSA